jgi:hypothetical protein
MFRKKREVSISSLSASMLVAAVLAVPFQADALDLGVSVGGVKADVGASVGGKSVAGADVGASVGGSNGVNAKSSTSIGGSRGLVDSGTTASIGGGNGVNADVKANVGGSRGLVDADVNANVGGRNGLRAGVDANVGQDSLLDADIGLGLGGGDAGAPGGNERNRDILRQFSQMPQAERLQLIKRCRGVSGGGYDAALVKLCRLLETASR